MWISLFSRVWGDISSRKKTTGIKTTTGLFFPLSITKVSIPLENFQASKHTTNGDFQKKNGYSTIIPIWLGTIIPYKTSINPKQPQGPNFIAHVETKKNHLTLQVASHRPERLRNFEPDGRTRGTPVGLLTWSSNDAKKSKKKHLCSKKKVSRFQKKNAFYQLQSTSCDLWTFSKISKSPKIWLQNFVRHWGDRLAQRYSQRLRAVNTPHSLSLAARSHGLIHCFVICFYGVLISVGCNVSITLSETNS